MVIMVFFLVFLIVLWFVSCFSFNSDFVYEGFDWLLEFFCRLNLFNMGGVNVCWFLMLFVWIVLRKNMSLLFWFMVVVCCRLYNIFFFLVLLWWFFMCNILIMSCISNEVICIMFLCFWMIFLVWVRILENFCMMGLGLDLFVNFWMRYWFLEL